jgi:hypothetical protein
LTVVLAMHHFAGAAEAVSTVEHDATLLMI